MNRNLDGTEMTREQLLPLALEAGMSPEKNTVDVKTWVFFEACRALRFDMWCRGELLLDTRPVPRAPFVREVDWEFVRAMSPVGVVV